MATAALTVVGTALGGPIGGALGGAIGSYIDNTLLFPPDDQRGPRIDSMPLSGAAEGDPMWKCYGPKNRVPGTIIYVSDLIETQREEDVGKGGGPSVTTYEYAVDIAIALCEGVIQNVKTIWADAKRPYVKDRGVNVSSDQLTATAVTVQAEVPPNSGNVYDVAYFLDVLAPSGDVNLAEFLTGFDVTMSGWAQASNNGTFKVVFADTKSDGSTTFRVQGSSTFADDSNAGNNTITCDQDLPDLWPNWADSLTIYPGSTTQTADSVLEARLGSGNVPAYRGTAYVVFESFQLKHVGNRVPNFSAEVEADTSLTVAAAVGAILERSGLDSWSRSSSQYDTSGVSGSLNLTGYALRGPTDARSALEPLMVAYSLVAQEASGQLIFKDRDSVDTVAVDSNDLAAHESGSDAPRVLRFTDHDGTRLPSEVNVRYLEDGKNYQSGSQRERRIDYETDTVWQVDLGNLVLTASKGREIARRTLWTAWANRQAVEFRLPPSYPELLEGDRITASQDGEDYTILVEKLDIGHNGVMACEGVVEVASVLDFSGAESDSPVDPNGGEDEGLPLMIGHILDIAPFSDEHVYSPGYYFAASNADDTAAFIGGAVYESLDGGSTFEFVAPIENEATIGETTEALAAPATTAIWDNGNTLKVRLYGGSLETKTEQEVLEGANHCVVGDEVIGFVTATLQADGTYHLTQLLRGRRATEDATGDHTAADRFVMLGTGVRFVAINHEERGTDKVFRYVPLGGDVSDAVSSPAYTMQAATIRPFPATRVKGRWETDDDVVISWLRRTRALTSTFGQDAPVLDPPIQYEVDILDTGTVVRTLTAAEGATQVTYTSAQQTTDFGSPQTSIDVKVYYVSQIYGRGKAASETITPGIGAP